jgi:hypothetical protein
VPRLAADLAPAVPLSDAARALLTPTHTPRQFFDVLAAKPELSEDAIRFLAAALPKREAVTWAVAGVRGAAPKPDPLAAKALAAAEAWAKEPTEANCRACEPAAEAAGYGTAAGCAACAAFWSGGSLSAPHLPPVPPRDDLTGSAVAAALLLAGPAPDARATFLALGADIAAGKKA